MRYKVEYEADTVTKRGHTVKRWHSWGVYGLRESAEKAVNRILNIKPAHVGCIRIIEVDPIDNRYRVKGG